MTNEEDPELDSDIGADAEFDSDDVDAQVLGAEDTQETEPVAENSEDSEIEDELYQAQMEQEVDAALDETQESELAPSDVYQADDTSETEDDLQDEVSLDGSEEDDAESVQTDASAMDDLDHDADGSETAYADATVDNQEPNLAGIEPRLDHYIKTDDLAIPNGPFPRAIFRETSSGDLIIDATAGRSSVMGFGYAPISEAISSAAQGLVGDSAAHDERDELTSQPGDLWSQSPAMPPSETSTLEVELQKIIDDQSLSLDRLFVRPSADAAVDSAIGIVRRQRADKGYRTIALVGSDHGRTGMCRSASGHPELHEEFGPMMAGFSHVPSGNMDALRAAIDDQTVCVLLSPIDLAQAAVPCDADYLVSVREFCDEHDLALVIDETQLVFGGAGTPFHFESIAPIRADMVLLSAGLFGGLPGGLILASEFASGAANGDVDRFPIQSAVAEKTLEAMQQHDLPATDLGGENEFAVALARAVSGFQFVRDINATGRTIGIETDLEAADLVRTARSCGLQVAPSGNNGILIQFPLLLGEEEREQVLARLTRSMEAMERMTTELAN